MKSTGKLEQAKRFPNPLPTKASRDANGADTRGTDGNHAGGEFKPKKK